MQDRSSHRAEAFVFFFQAEDGIRDLTVTGVQTCALPIFLMLTARTDGSSGVWGLVGPRVEPPHGRVLARAGSRRGGRRLPRQAVRAVRAEIGRASCRERV